jgi:hypothetical protein
MCAFLNLDYFFLDTNGTGTIVIGASERAAIVDFHSGEWLKTTDFLRNINVSFRQFRSAGLYAGAETWRCYSTRIFRSHKFCTPPANSYPVPEIGR